MFQGARRRRNKRSPIYFSLSASGEVLVVHTDAWPTIPVEWARVPWRVIAGRSIKRPARLRSIPCRHSAKIPRPLPVRPGARFTFKTLRKKPRDLLGEMAVQKIQRLQWRRALGTPRRDLASIRTIEHAEDTIRTLADDCGINHSPEILRGEFL